MLVTPLINTTSMDNTCLHSSVVTFHCLPGRQWIATTDGYGLVNHRISKVDRSWSIRNEFFYVRWHRVLVSHRGEDVQVLLDGEEEHISAPPGNQHLHMDPAVYFGGLDLAHTAMGRWGGNLGLKMTHVVCNSFQDRTPVEMQNLGAFSDWLCSPAVIRILIIKRDCIALGMESLLLENTVYILKQVPGFMATIILACFGKAHYVYT